MLDGAVIDFFPFPAKAQFEKAPEIEDWENDKPIHRIVLPCPFGNHPVSHVNVVAEGKWFLVTHTTIGGRWIEHNRRRFRTFLQALKFAAAQSTARAPNGRLWTYEIDGETFWLDVKWDLHIRQEQYRLLTQLAA